MVSLDIKLSFLKFNGISCTYLKCHIFMVAYHEKMENFRHLFHEVVR